jgi:RNase H-fold protein (predicted Holliday junction resolvase)
MTDHSMGNEVILGFDPGKDKCGVAVMSGVRETSAFAEAFAAPNGGLTTTAIDSQQKDRELLYHQVLLTAAVITKISDLCSQYNVTRIVIGDQTTSKQWQQQLTLVFPDLPISLVDERYSSLAARDRYWQMYPANFLTRLIPQGMRQPPRPIDDIVAIILIERYLKLVE